MIKKYFRRLCIFIFCIWIFYSIQFVYKVFIGPPLCLTIKIADNFKNSHVDIYFVDYWQRDDDITEQNTYWQGRINYTSFLRHVGFHWNYIKSHWNVDWDNAFNFNTIHLNCNFGESIYIVAKLPDGGILRAESHYHPSLFYENHQFIIGNNDIIYLKKFDGLTGFFRYHFID